MHESSKKRFLRNSLGVLVILILGLMALGAGVRTMGAGLACPDWPLCYGKVIPDFHVGTYFEFIHRSYAGLIGIIFFALTVMIYFSKEVSRSVKRLAIFASVVLLAQIIMGGLTVLKLLKVEVVTSHLALATIFLSAVLWMYFGLKTTSQKKELQGPSWLGVVGRVIPFLVFAQILLGGLVASSYAGLVCVDFPKCGGQWIPTLSGPIGLQVLHRFGAYVVALVIFAIAGVLHFKRNEKWMTNQIKLSVFAMVALVVLQIILGIANLLLFIPPWIAVTHHAVAIVLLIGCWHFSFYASLVAQPARGPSLVTGETVASH